MYVNTGVPIQDWAIWTLQSQLERSNTKRGELEVPFSPFLLSFVIAQFATFRTRHPVLKKLLCRLLPGSPAFIRKLPLFTFGMLYSEIALSVTADSSKILKSF
jgi:hypothetical protein